MASFLCLRALFLVSLLCVSPIHARDVPDTVQSFYQTIRNRGKCSKVLAGGFHSMDNDGGNFDYCGDYLDKYNIIYLQGKKGQLVNMDVDCDGQQSGPADDGRCASSTDTQTETSFRDDLRSYGSTYRDLDANVHPYVVFGNEGSKKGWPTFDPEDYDVQPLSIMAVVCNNRLIYGVWGDTNGDDGKQAMVGEASISLATACFGNSMQGDTGHDTNDVLYIAFPGDDAVPGATGARWNATSYAAFEQSISAQGDRLITRVGSTGAQLLRQNGCVLVVVVLSMLLIV